MAEQFAGGGNHLQLARALVNIGHALVAHQPFDLELAHVPDAAVNLHRLEAHPVAHLGRIIFHDRGEGFGERGSRLEVLARGLRIPGGAFGGGAFIHLQQVHPAARFPQQRPGGFDLAAHRDQHPRDRLQFADRLAELDPLAGIFIGLAVGGLGDPERLGGDGQAGAVHQRHRRTDAFVSMSAPRPAALRRCCSNAARHASTPSMSAARNCIKACAGSPEVVSREQTDIREVEPAKLEPKPGVIISMSASFRSSRCCRQRWHWRRRRRNWSR